MPSADVVLVAHGFQAQKAGLSWWHWEQLQQVNHIIIVVQSDFPIAFVHTCYVHFKVTLSSGSQDLCQQQQL